MRSSSLHSGSVNKLRESTIIQGAATNMKGSVYLKTGKIQQVNERLTHPFTKLDLPSAQMITQKLFSHYTRGNLGTSGSFGRLGKEEAKRMMIDAYKCAGRDYSPTDEDVEDYIAYHDRDNDGGISAQDLEIACTNYLCGAAGEGYSLQGRYENRDLLLDYFVQDNDPNSETPLLTTIGNMIDDCGTGGADGDLSASDIRQLLSETYRLLGKHRQFTDQEISAVMEGRQRLSKRQFGEMVQKSLVKRRIVKE